MEDNYGQGNENNVDVSNTSTPNVELQQVNTFEDHSTTTAPNMGPAEVFSEQTVNETPSYNYVDNSENLNQNSNYYEEKPKKKIVPIILILLVLVVGGFFGFKFLNSGIKFSKSSDEKYEALRKKLCEAAEEYVTSGDAVKLEVEKSTIIKYQKLSDANLIEARIENPYYKGGLFKKSEEDKYYSMNNSVRITRQTNGTYTCDLVDNSMDVTPPELRLSGDEEIELVVGTEFSDPGYIATDDFDGDITDRVARSGNVDINKAGEYTLTYTAQDSAGNITTKTRKFVYKELSDTQITLGSINDNVIPMIQLKGDNPYCMVRGTKYIEPGAIATDNVDGNITELIAITNKVTGNLMGTFKVVYTVEDSAGNKATAYRTVLVSTSCDSITKAVKNDENSDEEKVLDIADLIRIKTVHADDTQEASVLNIAPKITLVGKSAVTVALGTQYIDLGATAYDKEDGDITSKIITDSSSVNMSAPGVYKVIYRVSDNGVNGQNIKTVTATRTVTVINTISRPKTFVRFLESKSNITVDVGKGNDTLIKAPKAIDETGRTLVVTTRIEDYVTKEVVKSIDWNQVGKYRVTFTAVHSNGLIRQTQSTIVTITSGTVKIGGKTTIDLALRQDNCDITEIDLVKGGVTFTASGNPTITLENNKGKACIIGKSKIIVTATGSNGESTKKIIVVNVTSKESTVIYDAPSIVTIAKNSANSADPYNRSKKYVGGSVSGINLVFRAIPSLGTSIAYFEYSKNCNSVDGKIPVSSKANTGTYDWKKEGEYAVCIRAVSSDKVPGPWSDPVYLYLDLTGPKAKFTHEWADGSSDWHNTALTLKYDAVDEGSGLSHFEYTYDDVKAKKASEITTYYEATGTLTVQENTEPNRPILFVFVRAVDKVGNKGEWTLKPAYANIDSVAPNAPKLEINENGSKYASVVAMYKDNSSIRPSGPNGVIYRINGEDEQESKIVAYEVGSKKKKVANTAPCNPKIMKDNELKACLTRKALTEEWYKIELPLNTTSSNVDYKVEAWSVDKAGNRSATSSTITATKAPGKAVQSVIIKNGNTEIKEGGNCQLKKLYVGGKIKLTATAVPADADSKDVKWIIGNTKVATINQDGEIVAKKIGTTAVEAVIGTESRVCSLTVSPKLISCKPGQYLPAGEVTCAKCLVNHYCAGLNNVAMSEEVQGIEECKAGYASLEGASKCVAKKVKIVLNKNYDDMGEVEQTFTYGNDEEISVENMSGWGRDNFELVGLSEISGDSEAEFELNEPITKEFIDNNCDSTECTINLNAVWKQSPNVASTNRLMIPPVTDDGGSGSGSSNSCYAGNCTKCVHGQPYVCALCASGYVLNNGRCVQPVTCNVSNCKACAPANSNKCTTCNVGYTLKNGKCEKSSTGTAKCYCCGGSQGCTYKWSTTSPGNSCTVVSAVLDASSGKQVAATSGNCSGTTTSKITAYCNKLGKYYVSCPDGYTKSGTADSYGCVTCNKDVKTSCRAGEYLSNGKCNKCPAGTYSLSNSKVCTKCPAGTYSTAGAGSCTRCKVGTYSASAGATSCTKCPAGTYTASAGSKSCTTCPAGSYCTGDKKVVCPSGTYSNGGSAACTKCPAGSYCTSGKVVKCPSGQYSAAGATSCSTCSAGTYSKTGASTCQKCPVGYKSEKGASVCYIDVPAGKYIAKAYDSTATTCPSGQTSSAHTVSYGGTSKCSKCKAGTYYVGGKCIQCPSGYTSDAGAESKSMCYKNISAGYWKNEKEEIVKCPAGSYSKSAKGYYGGAYYNCTKCPAGTYSDKEGTVTCTKCPIGTYSDKTGATKCTTAPDGYTTSTVGSVSYIQCSAGSYCKGGISTKCPAGTYAQYKGMSSCTKCEKGTYSKGEGRSVCTKCEAGTYTDAIGSTSCKTCAPGTYSNSGSSSCTKCPTGYYNSNSGASSCISCPLPTYSDTPGATSCKTCPDGTYAIQSRTKCIACPTNAKCSGGKISCIDGYYETNDGQCAKCPAGSYCYGGTRLLCSAGTYSNKTGGTSCTKCSAGTYSSAGATSCTKCPVGTYSNGGSAGCTKCPAGSYSDKVGTANHCQHCSFGTYSNIVGATSCKKCAAGYIPSSDATSCTKCPNGTYSSAGATSCTKCTTNCQECATATTCAHCASTYTLKNGKCERSSCSAGSYWDDSTKKCKKCAAGYYSTVGAFSCGMCQAGTYSASGAGSCTKCPAGTYSHAGASKCA